MKERIRAEEQEHLRRKKMSYEVKKLSEELKKDKRAWEDNDWKTSAMVDKWWESIMEEEAERSARHERINGLEKEERIDAMDGISAGRIIFFMLYDYVYSEKKFLTTTNEKYSTSPTNHIKSNWGQSSR